MIGRFPEMTGGFPDRTGRLPDALLAVLFTAILTCWAPGYWPVALVHVGAFSLLAWVVLGRQPVPAGLALWALAGTVAWGAWQLAAGSTVYRFETVKALLYWAANASAFLVAGAACAATPGRNRFLRGLLWFGALVSLLVVMQYFTSQGRVFWLFAVGRERVLGPFLYKNQCAAYIELLFPLAVYQSMVDDRHWHLYMAMAATMFAAVITAVSRAGAVLVVGELAAVTLLAWRRGLIPRARLGKRTAWTAAFGMALATVVGWQVTLDKFREPEPYRVRRELLLSSLGMIAGRPLAGFGLGAWPVAYPAFARFDNGLAANHAHNDWAEWAAEGGLPFLGLLMVVAFGSARPAANSLWGIGVPVIFVHSLVDYPLREPALAVLLFAMLGALAARPRRAWGHGANAYSDENRMEADPLMIGVPMKFLRAALVLLTGWAVSAGMAAAQTAELAPGNLPAQKIGSDDLVAVAVYQSPELTGTVRVSAEGQIRLPMLKRGVAAAGLLPRELESGIAEALRAERILVDPIVTVTVSEYRSRPISVAGAVKRPLTFQASGSVTLIEALTRAEGLAPEAGSEILLTHGAAGNQLPERISVKALFEGGHPELNPRLAAGDEIRVPEADRVYVAGSIKNPGAFPMKDDAGVTVLKLLALAGGLAPFASGQAYIYRRKPGADDGDKDRAKEEIPVALSRIIGRKSPDVTLLAGDIFYVPDAKGRRISAAALERIAGFGAATASGLLIWR